MASKRATAAAMRDEVASHDLILVNEVGKRVGCEELRLMMATMRCAANKQWDMRLSQSTVEQ